MSSSIMIHCREASRLLLLRLDQPLATSERWQLRGHLMICQGCRRFRGQVGLMQKAMGRWRAYRDE